MTKKAAATSNQVLKELLGTALRNLGREGEAKEAEARPGPRARLPASREFRKLHAEWKKGGLPAAARLALLREVVTRHLRHAAPILLVALRDEDPRIRELAAQNLGEAKVEEAEGPLLTLLTRERESTVLRAAVRSLGVLRSKKALPAVVELGQDPELLRPVAFAAARIGGPEGRAYLEGLRATHSGTSEREITVRKLVDFLLSEEFAKQEEAMEKVRRRRLE